MPPTRIVPHAPPPAPPPSTVEDAGALFREHAQRVARWASLLGGPGIDAEDVVQEVFLTVQRHLPSFRGESLITTWLYRITANAVRHRRRRERVRRFFGVSSPEQALRVASPRPTPVEELERRQTASVVYRVLDRLSDKQRTALILFELEGLSGHEIAERMDISPNNVWVLLHRARDRFAAELEGLERREGDDSRWWR